MFFKKILWSIGIIYIVYTVNTGYYDTPRDLTFGVVIRGDVIYVTPVITISRSVGVVITGVTYITAIANPGM